MARTTTYAFTEIYMTFTHPAVGTFTLNGEGIGDVNVTRLNDNTQHDVAADGSVMVSKIKADNGSITVNMQQTSDFHKFLRNWFNAINIDSATFWAAAEIQIQSLIDPSDNIRAIGVSPQKPADQPYQAQGQQVAWTFMAAQVNSMGGNPLGQLLDL